MKHWNLRAFHKAPIHPDFDHELEGSMPMVPVILSHGLHSNRRLHFNTATELASNGCIVYCINHTDGSSLSYQNPKSDEFILFENPSEKDSMQQKINHRVSELGTVIDVIKEEAKTFRIDLTKLISLGEDDIGAISVVELSNERNNDIKFCISINPKVTEVQSAIEKGDFTVN